MVAQREESIGESALKDGKCELDLGIEGSIRRCEALLAMVPLSLQSSIADGALRSGRRSWMGTNAAQTCLDLEFEKKLTGLEPEWTKNMGLLSSITDDRKSTPPAVDGKWDFPTSEIPSQEDSLKNVQNEVPNIPKPRPCPVPSSPNSHLDYISIVGTRTPKNEIVHKKVHIKRLCSRGSEGSSASEDWTIDFSPADTTTTSVSGSQDGHSCQDPREGGDNLSSSKKSGKMGLHILKSSWLENKNEKSTCALSVDGLAMAESGLLSVPSSTPTMEGDLEEVDTRKRTPSMHSDSSRGSRQSFETLCFTFTTPQHCEEAWEWFDKCSVDTSPDFKYEGNVIHEVHPQREKPLKHFIRSRWKPDDNILEQMHLTRKSVDNSGKLKPKGIPTNYRRSKSASIKERQKDGQKSMINRAQTMCATTGKFKTVADMASLRRLARPRTALYQRYAQTKALLEEEQMSECSFKPVVGRRPDPGSSLSAPIVDRLSEMKQRIEFRKRARKVIEKEELDQCSFWPKINLSSVYLDMDAYQPIQERLQELLRKRDERIAQARAQEAKVLTFKPEINQKSLRLFKQKGLETIDVADRLTSCGPPHFDGNGECRAKVYRPKDECTFSPEINPNTDDILAGSKFEGCDFLSRQQQFLCRLEQHKRIEQIGPTDLTFHPNIGNASFILRSSPFSEVIGETLDERLDRLSRRDSQRRCHVRQRIADNYYSQFRFQPKIDQTSRTLGRAPTIQELYINERGKRCKEALQQVAHKEFQQQCTFHPDVNTHKSTDALEKLLQDRRKFRQERAKIREAQRVVRELQEVKECTFKPAVHPVPPKDKEPVAIKGLGRHLELQDLAKQMKKDQEEWERKVFFSHVHELPKRQYTIPKPFVLRSGRPTSKGAPMRPDHCISGVESLSKTTSSSHQSCTQSQSSAKGDASSTKLTSNSSCDKKGPQ